MDLGTPRPASTVAILRDGADGADGIDVWLMRRNSAMSFAAGMQAFPGGAVEADDHDALLPWAGPPARALTDVMGVGAADVAALMSAAVRETFEECGVLLTRGAASADDHEPQRLALLDGTLAWWDFLASSELAINAAALVPWSRWITPDWSPRRFDAYFFLAALPPGQEPRWIDGEADRADWTGVREAVVAHEQGELPMMPPTIETLRSIAPFATVVAALAAAPDHLQEESG